MAKEYHKNPRKATKELLESIKTNILKCGDLSGITHDMNTDEIITGNQRTKIINLDDMEDIYGGTFAKIITVLFLITAILIIVGVYLAISIALAKGGTIS